MVASVSVMPAFPTRPLPLGAFPLPFGFLLLPPGAETEPVRAGLLAGHLPDRWPASLTGHQAALAGDLDAARAAFGGTDPVSRFNRFVLDPDAVDPQALRADLGPSLGVLVDLVEFATGRSDAAPDPAGHERDMAALLLAAQAVQALSSPGKTAEAVIALREAAVAAAPVSAALAGVLHGALGQACKALGDATAAIAALQAGIALLAGTDLTVARAEQRLELAATYHELAADAGAANVSPMMAPRMLNRAVELYEAALSAQDRVADPVGYARALANQGNALARLGRFDQARAKLAEARYLFEESQDWSALGTVRVLLDDLARQQKSGREVRADA